MDEFFKSILLAGLVASGIILLFSGMLAAIAR